MKLQTLGLSIATALLVAACGGSSSDTTPADSQKPANNPSTPSSPSKPSSPSTQQPGNNNPSSPSAQQPGSNNPSSPSAQQPGNNNPSKPSTPQPDNKVSGLYKGNVFVVPVGKMPGSLAEAKATSSDSLTTLNANDKRIGLQLPGIISGHITSMRGVSINGQSYKLFIVSGTRYANSKFGYINDGNEDYVFSQGAYTSNMPSTGTVTYRGDAAIGRSAVADTAVSNFTADFGQKTLKGSITQNPGSDVQFQPVNISATISGNAFSTTDNATVRSTGHFYGDKANEVGGVFHDSSQSLVGSFGAIRSN